MDLRGSGKGPEAGLCLKRKVPSQNDVSFAHFQAVVCCFKRCVFPDQLWFLLWPIPPPAVFLSSRTRRVFLWGGGGGALVADAPSMIKCGETETEMGRGKTPELPPLWAGNLRYIIHKVV